MNADDFRRRIVQAIDFIYGDLKIVRTISSKLSLSVSKGFNAVALDLSSTYSNIYRSAISLSQYNVMLQDYAVFQYSWESEESWRLAYLPNPWLSGAQAAQRVVADWEALEALGGLDQEAVTGLLDELPYQGAIPAIRFEYAVDQYRELAHPVAHLHIGRHDQNRWALARPLEPLTFTMMILRQYYPEAWNPLSSYHGGREETCLDLRFIRELSRTRLVHHFTDTERRSLHLTSDEQVPPPQAAPAANERRGRERFQGEARARG